MAKSTDGSLNNHEQDVVALDRLAAAIEDNVRDERLLVKRLRRMGADRTKGRSWHDLLGDKTHPPVLGLSTRVADRATAISAALRRRLIRGLRAEGATIPSIGETLGVSHQRVSTLLRREPPAVEAPAGSHR